MSTLPDPGEFTVMSQGEGPVRGALPGAGARPGDVIERVWDDGTWTWAPAIGPTRAPTRPRDATLHAWQVLRPPRRALADLVRTADAALSTDQPHLRRVDADGRIDDTRAVPTPGAGTMLVLVHGALSGSAHTWRGLRAPDADIRAAWRGVHKVYAGEIYAFEHPTLSQCPVESARALLALLAPGRAVSLLTHGRGGMVGELLAGAGRLPERVSVPGLADLRLALTRGPDVRRHTRIACPVRGTRLASRRHADVLAALAAHVALVRGTAEPGRDLTPGLLAAARALTSAMTSECALPPAIVPGLAGMLPDSPAIRAINAAPAACPRVVITGAHAFPDALGERVSRLLPDGWSPGGDLLVDTGRMATEAEAPAVLRLEAPELHHHAYLTHPAARARVLRALLQPPWQASALRALRGGAPRGPGGIGGRLEARPPSGDGRDVAFVLPGLMGSTLAAPDSLIWAHLARLVAGDFTRLDLSQDRGQIRPDGVIKRYYLPLVHALQARWDVGVFAFDWRKPLSLAADALAAAIAPHLAAGRRVHLVAHSMGGAVVQALAAGHPELWARMAGRGEVILLGPPLRGAWAAVGGFLGEHELVRLLIVADLCNDEAKLLDVMASFEGVLSVMPSGCDWYAPHTWRAAGRVPPARLAEAGATRARLDGVHLPASRRVRIVLGQAQRTLSGWDGGPLWSPAGDGTILWDSSILPGHDLRWVRAAHGDLPRNPVAIGLVIQWLTDGVAGDAATPPPIPAAAGGDHGPFWGYPTSDELVAAAMGGTIEAP